MVTHDDIKAFLKELEQKLKNEMPRIQREVKIYEQKLEEGTLNLSPSTSPQFDG